MITAQGWLSEAVGWRLGAGTKRTKRYRCDLSVRRDHAQANRVIDAAHDGSTIELFERDVVPALAG